LLLTEDLAITYDARFKVNPPLRSQQDVEALRAGVVDGTIDAIATDHAPHPIEEKESAWAEASFGMVGLESAVSVVQASLIDTGLLGWSDIARLLSSAPAAIGRLPGYQQGLVQGAPAQLTLIDPSAVREFGIRDLRGRSVNSPYLGMRLPGRVIATVHAGYPTVLDGELVAAELIAASAAKRRGASRG
ncbi:MAG: dihydroorotase, partial [Terrimesophilobacter sp.]